MIFTFTHFLDQYQMVSNDHANLKTEWQGDLMLPQNFTLFQNTPKTLNIVTKLSENVY